MIELRDVWVTVPEERDETRQRVLLEQITLRLEEPRIAVIGANGSGKSTLLRLFNGLRLATSGEVRVAGLDPAQQGKQVRSQVGFIFTDPLAQLLMSTPIEDVELSLRASLKDRRARMARAQQLLDERGIGHIAHHSIYDISGGERQLVALTSILAINPSIIVADEPTTLLDLRNKLMLRRILAELDQQVIYSTHDLEVAADADRVIVIADARVVADGAPAETINWYRNAMTQ